MTTINQLAAQLVGINRATVYRWFAEGLLLTAIDEQGRRYVPESEIELCRIAVSLRRGGLTMPAALISQLREATASEREQLLRDAVIYLSGGRYTVAPCADAVPLGSRPTRIVQVSELLL